MGVRPSPQIASCPSDDSCDTNSMGLGVGGYTGQELNNTDPLQRDTVVIPANSFVVLRFITDNRECSVLLLAAIFKLLSNTAGLWAFHCHIAWHMAAGLLMQISSLPSKAAQLNIPQDIISQCASASA